MDISQWSRKDRRRAIEVGVIGLVLFIGLFLFLALRALPGDMLYGTKVNVLEESYELLYIDTHAEAEYHLHLLERRFRELEQLGEKDVVVEGDVHYLHEEMRERAAELVALFAEQEGARLTLPEIIMYSHEAAAILRAAELYAEGNESFVFFEEEIEDSRREADNRFDERVEQFVASANDEGVQTFVTELIQRLEVRSTTESLNSVLREDVSDSLDRALDFMREDDAVRAIKRIEDGLRLIEVADLQGTIEIEPEPVVVPRTPATSTPVETTPTVIESVDTETTIEAAAGIEVISADTTTTSGE